VTAHPTYGHPR